MKQLYSKAFANTFEAIQCLSWTVLYYDLDFDRTDLIKFQKGLTVNDKIIDDKDLYAEVYTLLLHKFGIDCVKMAAQFPYISKIKMAGHDSKKCKGIKATLAGCDNALEAYLLIFFHELATAWGKDADCMMLCYERMKENATLYRRGMKSEFVEKYFKDEIDLTITM